MKRVKSKVVSFRLPEWIASQVSVDEIRRLVYSYVQDKINTEFGVITPNKFDDKN